MSSLVEQPTTANPGHGDAFTEHMVTMSWTESEGWHEEGADQPVRCPLGDHDRSPAPPPCGKWISQPT